MDMKLELSTKPHVVLIPFPVQSHINSIFNLAKFLHFRGFHIAFVNSEYNHKRLLKFRGFDSLNNLLDFCFEVIPYSLPLPLDDDIDSTQDIPSLYESISKNYLISFQKLLSKLNSSINIPSLTYIISIGAMALTLQIAKEIGIPNVVFQTTSACSFLGSSF